MGSRKDQEQHSQIDVTLRRYASPEMTKVFSPARRIELWRELWIALAQAQQELGLPIKKVQIDEMKKNKKKIDWELAAEKEEKFRHDVMAHVHTYGHQCPKAAGIIHLGSTSAYVTDNADLVLMKEGLGMIAGKLASAIDKLSLFAKEKRATPTLAFTHFQTAQPTTVGKRACLWIQNFLMDISQVEFEIEEMRFLGAKGATGTQDSFLKLFEGDKEKVRQLDEKVTQKMGFGKKFLATGQTYPRKVDSRVLSALASICESASKFANDLRLLQALHEVEEPQEAAQIGSSAMPYKQNPMRSERICSLSRYVMNLVSNCRETASTQWFERTLDDSANRRLSIPQAFLITDAVLDLVINVASGMRVHEEVINQNLDRELPFLQTEEVLMAAVKEGGDRQELHERIREHSRESIKMIREKGEANDLLTRLRGDKAFAKVPPRLLVKTDASRLTGMAADQVDDFLKEAVPSIRRKYKSALAIKPKIRV
ncbi:MAG: adenylosuccinate lyase [Bdellovibrionales bacterium]|nr:adenylosuccinate lyase [Bdellovibrionales bacterium]